MPQDISYTAEEIAKLLKISKLTVYDLIKKGELPSYRVGKQMRVDASDLEAYKQKSRSAGGAAQGLQMQTRQLPRAPHPESGRQADMAPPPVQGSGANGSVRPIVITGQDWSLDLLARHLEEGMPGLRPLRSYAGSLDSLIGMYRGESDLVSTHLLDGDTGDYNLPYIRKLLVGSPCLVVHLLSRPAGFYVAKGNPLGLAGWADLSKPGLRLVNREKGAGARVLLDEQLRLHGIKAGRLNGYDSIQSNHLSVAAKVAAGEADVGIGIAKAASVVEQVDFIPLIQERYDLVMLKKPDNLPWIGEVLRIVQSDSFKRELQAMSGYDLSRTGEVLLDT